MNCSSSTYALDQTFPVDTADHAHEIDDIGLVTIKDSNGNAVNVAWVYFEFNGDEYLQETGNDPSVFDALLKSVPGLGELAQELEATHDGAMVSVAPAKANNSQAFSIQITALRMAVLHDAGDRLIKHGFHTASHRACYIASPQISQRSSAHFRSSA